MWILRVVSSILFLGSIVLSIPLAFDVGGRTCGLAFSLALATFYFFYSILRLLTPTESRFRATLVQLISLAQPLILPSLLIWSLNRFAVDADSTGWVERTFGQARSKPATWHEWTFGHDGLVESATIGSWDRVLRWSTPVFQLVEGFCSLLVIQAAGQITRWTVNRSSRSDTWMVRASPPYFALRIAMLTNAPSRSPSLSSLPPPSLAPSTSSGASRSSRSSTTSTPS